MADVRVNRWLDFADRVGWTAVQAAGAAVITVLATDADWQEGLLFVGVAVLLAIAKVAVAQHTGNSGLGDAVPGQTVIEKGATSAR